MLNGGRLPGFKVGGQWRFSHHEIEQWLHAQRADLETAYDLHPVEATPTPSPGLLPLSCVQGIQDIFAEALDIAAVVTSLDGVPLTQVANACEFCRLVLDSEIGRQRCISSWQAAAVALEPGSDTVNSRCSLGGDAPHYATCHAGLRYACGQIVIEGQPVAAVHAGQWLESSSMDRATRSACIGSLSAATGVEGQRLEDALALVPVLSRDQREQVDRLLRQVSATIGEIGEERLALLGRLQRIAEISQI
jgi:ligand-binding sensor protein